MARKIPARKRRAPARSTANQYSKYILNCVPSQETQHDWTFRDASSVGLAAAAPPPPSKDLREKWWDVGNQEQTGSCVGWASGEGVLRWHLVKAGRLAPTEHLSVRYLWMAAKETDVFTTRPSTFIEADGTSLKAALDIARNYGVVVDAVLPFKGGLLYAGDENSFYLTAAQRKIASYINLGRDPMQWRSWIATNGPVLTRLDVDETWYHATSTKGRLATYVPPAGPAGHAVAMVGYTPDGFIVRNSWGTGWGDNGFAYASNAYAAAAFTEAYGVIP